MDKPIYEIHDLSHSYGGKTALTIEHLTISPASIVGLIGPNGSGKSTLLKLLGMIERPTQGRIFFKGQVIEPFSDKARFLVTMLPQEPFLMKRNVFNNVSYGLKLRGNGQDTIRTVSEALSLVGLDYADYAKRPWYALSGGETQRVALAARLALKPEVLLLDEPNASVDAGSAQLIKDATLRARQEMGTTLIIASHDWQWLHEICDEVLHLFEGRIFGSGRENIIFGPWEPIDSGKWRKVLSDGQQLLVSKPPKRTSAAVIDMFPVDARTPTVPHGDTVLTGIVSRLSLERKTDQIFATILAGDLPLTVRLKPDKTNNHTLFPGQTISVHYHLDSIQWV